MSPKMGTLVQKLIPDLSGEVILIAFKFSCLDCSTMFRKSNVNKLVFFLLSLKYKEIITVKTVVLYKKLFFFSLKVLKVRKRSWH